MGPGSALCVTSALGRQPGRPTAPPTAPARHLTEEPQRDADDRTHATPGLGVLELAEDLVDEHLHDPLADLLVVNGNPLENIDLLADADKSLSLIMKDGKIYKENLQEAP